MRVNAETFVESLASIHILPDADLAAIRQLLLPANLGADAEALARDLIRQGKLTRFQASHIYQGRGKGLLFGDYVVLDKLGQGGMGQVFKAQHRRMKRIVALKLLPANMTSSERNVQRFYQEVEVAAKLTHPNIVTAYDAGESRGQHYLIMEYVEGKDLSAYVEKNGPLTVDQAVNCVLQAARGLEYAHKQGIVHRDIKPSNLLLDRQGIVKILDMGLARVERSDSSPEGVAKELTESGQTMGTVDYMAPEQALDTRTADFRADIYSLGCTLYRVLIGKPVFPGETMVQKILAHRERPIPSLRAAREDVPLALDQLFSRMLAKSPDDRIQPMNAIVSALEKLNAGVDPEESSVFLTEELPEDELEGLFKSLRASSAAGSSINKRGGSETTQKILVVTDIERASGATAKSKAIIGKVPPHVAIGACTIVAIAALVIALFFQQGGPDQAASPRPAVAVEDTHPSRTKKTRPTKKSKSATTASAKVKPVPVDGGPPNDSPVPLAKTPPTPPAAAKPKPEPAKPEPAKLAIPPAPDRLTEPVDLVKRVDVKKHRKTGEWSIDGSALVANDKQGGRSGITLPFIPPDEYDLTLAFESPLVKDGVISMNLFVGGRTIAATFSKIWCGIGTLDGLEYSGNVSSRSTRRIEANKPLTIVCAVRKGRVFANIDGEPVIDWSGDIDRLSPPIFGVTGSPLGLACWGMCRFRKVEIAPPSLRLPVYAPVDLLARVNIERDVVSGDWKRERTGIVVSPAPGATQLALPLVRPNEYVLTAVVERMNGGDAFGVCLPSLGQPVAAFFDGDQLAVSGLSTVGNMPFGANPTTHKEKCLLIPGRQHTIVCTVRRDLIETQCDGRTIFTWTKAIGHLGGAPVAGFRFLEHLWVGSISTGWRISKLALAPLDFEKLPVPPTDQLSESREEIRELASPAHATNASINVKTSTVETLLREAAEALDHPTRRYVLFDESLRLAGEIGDLPLAMNAAEGLAGVFDVDQRQIEKQLLIDIFKANRSTSAKHRLLTDVLKCFERAIAEERYDLADDLRVSGLKGGSRDQQRELQKEFKALGVELGVWKAEYDAYRKALDTLAAKADDRDAHAAVGRYLCFVRNDWSRGLALWEKGADPDWQELVNLELAESKETDEQVALGEQWWEISGEAATPLKWLYMERADFWYRQAISKATGKTSATIDQHRRKVALERKHSGNAFAPRHPLDSTKIGDHWFKFYPDPIRWHTAVAICEKLGGQIACPKTPDENLALAQFLLAQPEAKKTGKIVCWLGATDEEKNGDFRWLDGTPLAPPNFVNWQPGKPKNDGHWVGMTAVAETGGRVTGMWSDYADSGRFFVCEWDR